MNLSELNVDELKKRARNGDLNALQILRDSGYFQKKQAQQKGYILSSGQRRLWVLHQMDGALAAYNVPFALVLDGVLDTAVFSQALNTLAQRHDSLRTYFGVVDGEPRQFVHNKAEFPLTVRDLRQEADPQKAARQLAQKSANTHFDLQQFPLYRAELLQTVGKEDHALDQHIFLFTIHHIIADGWSMGLLVQELSAIYAAYADGLPNPLPPLSYQYHDYAAWQNRHLASPEGEADRAYWLEKLGGTMPLLAFPTDHSRPPLLTFAGDIVSTSFTLAETAVLQQLARQQGATLFMALVAWVKLLLYRYTGQNDIIVGTPIAGREQAEWQNLVGFLVNTLALRDDVLGDEGFVDLLARVRETAVSAYAHQQYPLDQLVIDLGVQRDLSRNPIFDVVVNLQYAADDDLRLGEVKIADFEANFTAAKFDLTFEFVETADSLHLHLNYNTNLYGRDRMERLLTHLHTLLAGLSAQPDQPLGKLPLLTAAERQQLLVDWNDTHTPFPRHMSIPQIFAAQVSKTPGATAVTFADQTLTYAQLNQRANQLAHYLRQLGVRDGAMVGIAMTRSVEMVVSLLAVLKAGAVFVPLDADYPQARLVFMLADTAVAVLLTQSHLQAQLPDTEAVVVAVDEAWAVISQQSEEELATAVTGESLAYIMYTSGSTGRPKGVAVPHRAILRLVIGANYAQLTADQTFLLLAPISFDASTLEIWGALLNGAKLVIAPPHKLSLAELGKVIRENGITILWLTAGLFTLMVEQQWADLAGVRQLLAGGDVLPLPQVQKVLRDLPQCQLINGYGPTENTTFTCCYPIYNTAQLQNSVPIGKPIANTQIYILDSYLQPVPVGVWGDLYAAGDGLALGYWQQPELTDLRFLDLRLTIDDLQFNRQSSIVNRKLYKTGDVARWLPDGNVQFGGRRDTQIKIRGFRIELGEVELAVRQFAGVRECVVVVQVSEAGVEKRLVAFVVAETAVDLTNLRSFLQAKLPDYMVPAHFVLLDQLPLSPNGKVDRRALSQYEVVGLHNTDDQTAPTTETEHQLAVIWQKALGVPQIGIHDDFFDLGGHSLLATRVVAQIQSEMGVQVRLRDLFMQPTIAGLAELVTTPQTADPNHRAVDPIPLIPTADHYPVSHAQRRLWVIDSMGVGRSAYNIPAAIWLNDGVDVAALQAALPQVVQRHEALRTRFVEIEGEPRQIVQETVAWQMSVVDTADFSAEELHQQIHVEAARPFDLTQAPLFRFTLFVGGERPLLLLTIHHIISDGWSLELLLNEARQLLAGAALPPLSIQYKDYAAWQRDFLASDTVQIQRQFWLDTLAGELPVLDLPTDYVRPSVQSFAGAEVAFTWSLAESEAILRLGQDLGATPFMTVLALVNGLLHRYTGQDDIILGYPVAGRDHPDLVGQVGFYVNMLPLRQKVLGDASWLDLVTAVRQTVTTAFDHQMYPFDLLVEELNLRRDMGRSPVFDVAVSMQNVNRPQADSLAWAAYEMEPGISKWDLTFFFHVLADGRLHLNVEYSTDLFAAARMERMVAHLRQLSQSVVQTPHLALNRLNILPEAERQLLAAFNETERPYPHQATIPAIFEAVVKRFGERTAVVFDNISLTYDELNKRANQLAHTLREQYAIQPEEPVGVLLDRSEWTAVALLGILKAGGTYLPIDPAYPPSRMAYILQDTGCRLVLSEPKHMGELAMAVDVRDLLASDRSDLELMGDGRSLAYIIYTSGSTGQPKGSLIEHRAVLRLVLNTNYIELNEESRILQTGSLAFDASTFEIWGALLNGGTLCLPGGEALLDAAAFGRLIRQHQANILFLTTSLFNQMVEADVMLFAGLKTVLSGGETVSVGHFNRLLTALPEVALLHVYGPTENTTFSTYYPVRQVHEWDVPIGYPIANSTVYILDALGQPVPIGIPGEICVGGDGVARGYLNQADLTDLRFATDDLQPNRKSKIENRKLYKTGDLGLWLPDGSVKFIGRIDNQLKVRGFRVEPGEIEQCLLGHTAVRETAVMPRTTSVGTKELLAYVVGERPLTSQELRAYLGETLPEYMIPAHFVQLPEFPLNRSGKIDRGALPEPELFGLGRGDDYVAPRHEREQVLAKVWQSVLGQPQVGIHDNYFELGGDSIRAIQITSRLLRQGWKLEIQDLFVLPTIAELGAMLKVAEAVTDGQGLVVGDVALTAVQRWFFAEHEGDLHHFNQAVLLRSRERLDEADLREALTGLVTQHDMLRVVYREIGDWRLEIGTLPRQEVLGEIGVDLSVVEIGDWDTALLEIEKAHRAFDLEKGALFKAVLLRLGDGDRLFLVGHHLLVDGVSWRVLLEDLARGYGQVLAGEGVDLGAKTASFQRWAAAVMDYVERGSWQKSEGYWTAVCQSSPHDDIDRGDTMYGATDTVAITLTEAETTALLRQTHHAYHTEMNDILLVALARALREWDGRSQTVITLEGHGRDRLDGGLEGLDVSRTVGWFTTLYPFVLALPETELGAQIKGMKERLRQVPRRGFDYGILRYIVGRDWQIRPFLSFNYLGQFDEEEDGFFSFAEEDAGTAVSPALRRQHELDVTGVIARGRLTLSLTYGVAWERPLVERLLQGYKEALLAVVTHCQQQLEGEKTASDFTADVSEDELSAILDLFGE